MFETFLMVWRQTRHIRPPCQSELHGFRRGFSGDDGPATKALIQGPAGIAVDRSGNLYIADYGNNRIRMVTASTGKRERHADRQRSDRRFPRCRPGGEFGADTFWFEGRIANPPLKINTGKLQHASPKTDMLSYTNRLKWTTAWKPGLPPMATLPGCCASGATGATKLFGNCCPLPTAACGRWPAPACVVSGRITRSSRPRWWGNCICGLPERNW